MHMTPWLGMVLALAAGSMAPEGETTLSLDLSRFEVRGQASASVLVAEFSDFRCPACEKFSLTVMPNLAKEFIAPGKVKVVFVDFPMVGDAAYTRVFESVHCAGLQGKYWPMHDLLWENVEALGDASLHEYAARLGLDRTGFANCLDSSRFRERVLNSARLGNKLGLGARPTFFIGRLQADGKYAGRYVVGAQSYLVFKSLITRTLER